MASPSVLAVSRAYMDRWFDSAPGTGVQRDIEQGFRRFALAMYSSSAFELLDANTPPGFMKRCVARLRDVKRGLIGVTITTCKRPSEVAALLPSGFDETRKIVVAVTVIGLKGPNTMCFFLPRTAADFAAQYGDDWVYHACVLWKAHGSGAPPKDVEPDALPPANTSECAHCHAVGDRLSECARCHMIRYCSRECQKAHWNKHKPTCRDWRTIG